MKGVRFYQDENGCSIKIHGWGKKLPNGCNGMAVFYENIFWSRIRTQNENRSIACVEAIAALQEGKGDGPYASSSPSLGYIQEHCKRISEKEAREQFPNLIKLLED